MSYRDFIACKLTLPAGDGFPAIWKPEGLYLFQDYLVDWILHEGCGACLIDCGLGKSPIQLTVAENIVRHTNRPVLIATPLAVSYQTVREAAKFGVDAVRCIDGKPPAGARVIVTNYHRLQHFDPADYAGILVDEASILKNVIGTTRRRIQRMMNKVKYRSLYSGTPAPNAFIELGTFSEALGRLREDQVKERFFRQVDGPTIARWSRGQRMSGRSDMHSRGWRFRGHAEKPFWRFVASWSRTARKPSDLGFPEDDHRYDLPPLQHREHLVECERPMVDENGQALLVAPVARGVSEQRQERRSTMEARAAKVAELTDHGEQAVVWCELNPEGEHLVEVLPDAVEVAGNAVRFGSAVDWRPASQGIESQKEEAIMAFEEGLFRVLVTKPRIAAWGLNLQNCHRTVFFGAMHSFEAWYQAIRRFWRFGQASGVIADLVTTPGEVAVLRNLLEKQKRAEYMFDQLIEHMNAAERATQDNIYTESMEVPAWL